MTDEQIRQNAEEYAKRYHLSFIIGIVTEDDKREIAEAYEVGAHSRDEEIRQLYDIINDYSEAIERLRNPWISVEERLPPIKIRVLFLDKNGKAWLGRNTIAMQAELESNDINNLLPPPTVPPAKPVITHWMPIPKLEAL